MSRNHWLIPEGTAAGVTVKANADGSFDVTGTSTDEAGISASTFTLEPGKKYTVSTDKLLSANGSSSEGCLAVQFYEDGARKAFKNFGHSEATKTVTLTAPSAFDYATCMVYTGGAGNAFDVAGIHVMLNEGETAETWVPSGDLPPDETGETGYGFKVGSMSLADFGQCVASRETGVPEKKMVTKTVPHMSGFYDFSKLYGAVAYESREQTYSIDILGEGREDLQAQRSDLLTWLSTIHDEDIFDEDMPGWHLHGSFSGADWSEAEDGESGTLSVTFLCQPFLVADDETTQVVEAGEAVVTNAGQTTAVTASTASGTATVVLGGVSQSVSTTPQRLSAQLQPGDNTVKVTGSAVTLSWREQRL